ncbi:MAG: Cna B-type domain-containing protein, partial [Eubacteriales bacterium]|nr:Cna B-type domain-containing protein [Eubacteriales bacterium]
AMKLYGSYPAKTEAAKDADKAQAAPTPAEGKAQPAKASEVSEMKPAPSAVKVFTVKDGKIADEITGEAALVPGKDSIGMRFTWDKLDASACKAAAGKEYSLGNYKKLFGAPEKAEKLGEWKKDTAKIAEVMLNANGTITVKFVDSMPAAAANGLEKTSFEFIHGLKLTADAKDTNNTIKFPVPLTAATLIFANGKINVEAPKKADEQKKADSLLGNGNTAAIDDGNGTTTGGENGQANAADGENGKGSSTDGENGSGSTTGGENENGNSQDGGKDADGSTDGEKDSEGNKDTKPEDEKNTFSVSVKWIDGNNKDGNRPDSITVTVNYQDESGTAGVTEEPKEEDPNKSGADNENGQTGSADSEAQKKEESDTTAEIKLEKESWKAEGSIPANKTVNKDNLSVEEKGYQAVITGDAESGFVVAMTQVMDIKMNMTWDDSGKEDKRSDYGVTLYADGKAVGEEVVLKADELSATWEKQPKYTESNEEIKYTVEETTVPSGYSASVSGTAISGFSIINTIKELMALKVTVKWVDGDDKDGMRPDTLSLKARFKDGSKEPFEIDKDSEWRFDGKVISHGEWEGFSFGKKVDGYKASYHTNKDGSYEITMTRVIDITMKMTWDDNDNQYKKREAYRVTLKADGKTVGKEISRNADDLTYTWKNQVKYSDKNEEIKYTVEETKVPPFYNATVSDYEITNKMKDVKPLKVTVKWSDTDESKRPEKITVCAVFDDGTEDGKTGDPFEITKADKWTFDDIIVSYGKGEIKKFTVSEVDGYQLTRQTVNKSTGEYVLTMSSGTVTNPNSGKSTGSRTNTGTRNNTRKSVLPQTGQQWFQSILLLVIGIMLVVFGVVMTRRTKNKKK